MDEYSSVPNHLAPNVAAKKPREWWICRSSCDTFGDSCFVSRKPLTDEQKETEYVYEHIRVIEASYAKELEAEIERLKSERDAAVEALRDIKNECGGYAPEYARAVLAMIEQGEKK